MIGAQLLVAMLIALMRLFPDAPLSRLLHLYAVERPIRSASNLKRQHLIFLLVLVAMAFAMGEVVAVLGSADLAFGLAWDLSLYLDAVAIAIVVAGARHATAALRMLRGRLPVRRRIRGQRSTKRKPRSRPQRQGSARANDDDPARAIAQAA